MLLLPKVIRILMQLVASAANYRPKGKIGAVFLKNLSFSRTSTQVSDFFGLKIYFVETHAKGFAAL